MHPLPAQTLLDAFLPVGTLAEALVHKGPQVKLALRAADVDGRFSHLSTETRVQVTFTVAHYRAGGVSERKPAPRPASSFRLCPALCLLLCVRGGCRVAALVTVPTAPPEPGRSWGTSRGRSPPRAPGSWEPAESAALPVAGSVAFRQPASTWHAHLARRGHPIVPGAAPRRRDPGWGGRLVSPVAQLPLWPFRPRAPAAPPALGVRGGGEGQEAWWLRPRPWGSPGAPGPLSTCAGRPPPRSPPRGSGSLGTRKICEHSLSRRLQGNAVCKTE